MTELTMIELDDITLDDDEDEVDESGWTEMIEELDEEYMEAFRWADESRMNDIAFELTAFGYGYEHCEKLRCRVYKEMADYECYLEHPEWFADDEIPSRPDFFGTLSEYLYRS